MRELYVNNIHKCIISTSLIMQKLRPGEILEDDQVRPIIIIIIIGCIIQYIGCIAKYIIGCKFSK